MAGLQILEAWVSNPLLKGYEPSLSPRLPANIISSPVYRSIHHDSKSSVYPSPVCPCTVSLRDTGAWPPSSTMVPWLVPRWHEIWLTKACCCLPRMRSPRTVPASQAFILDLDLDHSHLDRRNFQDSRYHQIHQIHQIHLRHRLHPRKYFHLKIQS